MKDTSISKKINKTINADRLLGILCFSIGKKRYVLSLGMPPFTGSNYIRKKRPDYKQSRVEEIPHTN